MIGLEQVLLLNTMVSSIALIVLLFLAGRKSRPKSKRKYLSKDLRKIKEQIVD